MISIRPALFDDWPTIVEFNCRLAEESEGKLLDRSCVEPGVKALLSDSRKGRYFVAELATESGSVSERRIVGQLMHTFEWSDWRNGDIWWLQSVYVHPDHRRMGVFRALFERLKSEAEADPGVVGLRLYVEEQNARAHETYACLGLKPGGYFVMERMHRRSV
jgi:GNAT superfamily N-acetyltransferase